MKKLNLILILAALSTSAHAEMIYTDENMEIVLLDDLCSPSQPMVRLAYATDLAHTDKADGCWWESKQGTYAIELDRGDGTKEKYRFAVEKFRKVVK